METLDAHFNSKTDIKAGFFPEQPDREVEVFAWVPSAVDSECEEDEDTHSDEI